MGTACQGRKNRGIHALGPLNPRLRTLLDFDLPNSECELSTHVNFEFLKITARIVSNQRFEPGP